MKKLSIAILFLTTIIAYSCSSHNHNHGEEEHTETTSNETVSDIVSLTNEQMKAIQAEIGTIEQKNLASSIKVNGKLEVPSQNKALVTSLYEGVLQSILVHPGSEVRKGQVIATITNTQLSGIQQEYISGNAQLKLATLEYNRQKDLVAGNAAPMKNLQKAQAELSSIQAKQEAIKKQLAALGITASSVTAGRISSTLTLTAPISGAISDIHSEIGSKIDVTTPVATIVNNAELHLDLYVYEKDLALVKKGQIIHFTLTNNPGKEYDAKIFAIGTAFADESKSVPVHADVEGDKTGLIEGMSVTAVISIGSRMAPAIPNEAIVTKGGNDYIFMVTDKQPNEPNHKDEATNQNKKPAIVNFERVQVVRGVSDLGFTEIQTIKPLPANAKIVVKGAFFIMAKMDNTSEHHHH